MQVQVLIFAPAPRLLLLRMPHVWLNVTPEVTGLTAEQLRNGYPFIYGQGVLDRWRMVVDVPNDSASFCSYDISHVCFALVPSQ